MSRDHDHDLEKGDPDSELNREDTDSTTTTGRTQVPALTKEPDIPTTAAPCANSEDILKIPQRGRQDSRSSHSSSNSARTLSDDNNNDPHDHHSDRSRAQSSNRSVQRDAEKVPRGQRRGLLARFAVVAEITDAHDYPRKTKWLLTVVIATAGAAAPMASSIVLPALVDIARYFDTTATVVNLSVALYMLSMAIFPLWWSSFSETLGRRTIYLTSFAMYVLFAVLGGVSTNVGMFLAMRVLNGAAGASVQAVGAGTIADIWEVKERGRAIGFFYLGPLCGPLLAPIIGGALNQTLGWRSIQWFLTILGGGILALIVLCLPETLQQRSNPVAALAEDEAAAELPTDEKTGVPARPALSRTTTRQSVQVKTKTYLTVLQRCFVEPLRIVLYLQFPAVAICVFYATTTFAGLYMLNISVQQTFSTTPYSYTSIIVGLLYIPNSMGYFVTSIFGGRWVDWIMAREARKAGRWDEKGRLIYRPEDRMRENVWIAAVMFPAALIVYGWTVTYGVNVAVPLVANFFFGIGSMLVFAAVTTMLTEFMPRKASNGVALNNFVRNIFSCIGGAVTDPLIDAIGNGWMFTGMGVICLVSGAFSIWAMRRYGDHWRITMDRKIDKVQGK
ncbi:uncharacterized protein LTR77_006777 [Saxophila tyrrhenica]|uniref:Major facilitator superfamily (MFS) profile domain-containing protein n=1 Tax=Saxophila tyrrhenica TaxID=1690608 RepID=A0AAV9P8N2_9PEZI|nr:hypothetical protein LTR77_006777 [Saxophila tyrrhenica]